MKNMLGRNIRLHNHRILVGMYILIDYAGIVLAEKTALWLQSLFRLEASMAMLLPWDYQYVYIPCMFLLFLFMSDGYRFNRPSLDMVRDVFKGSGFGFLMYVMVIFLMRNSMQVSRYYAFCFLLFFLMYIFLGRVAISKLLRQVTVFREQILLIGAGKTAERLLSALELDPCYWYQVAGILVVL